METPNSQEQQTQIVGKITLKDNKKDGLIIVADGITVDLGSRPNWESSCLLATAILPNSDLAEEKIGERSRQVADFLKREGEDKEGAKLLARMILNHLSESVERNKKKSQEKISHLKRALEVISLVNREIIGPKIVGSTKQSLYPQGSPWQGRFSPPETWLENRLKGED